MEKYKGFKIGETVILNESVVSDYTHIDAGTEFEIMAFPPCTIYCKYKYFVYGQDSKERRIRVFINQIIKRP